MSSTETGTRARILEAARQVLEDSGGQAIRLEDIARKARVSRQAVYLHFGSRTELFIATVRYIDEVLGLEQRVERIVEACRAGDPGRMIRETFGFWADYLPEIYRPAKALLLLKDSDAAAAAAWNDRMTVSRLGYQAVVEQLARMGLLAPHWTVEAAGDLLWSLMAVEVWERLVLERGWTRDQYVDNLSHLAMRALLTNESAS